MLLLGVANLLGVYDILSRWDVLAGLEMTLPVWGLLIPAAAWGAAWLALAWGLWTLRAWARRATLLAFPLYEVMLIGRRLVFARGAASRVRLPGAVALAVLSTALVVLILTREGTRSAFQNHLRNDEETEIR